MRRLLFWKDSVVVGTKWLYAVFNPVLFVLGVLAVLGVFVVVGVTGGPPALLVALGALIVLTIFGEGSYRLYQEEVPQWSSKKTPIVNKAFRNERVDIDGKSFSGCTFENVTFVYHGQGPFDLMHSQINGTRHIDVRASRSLDAFQTLLRALEMFNPEIQYFEDE
jgi:hypothetical protein